MSQTTQTKPGFNPDGTIIIGSKWKWRDGRIFTVQATSAYSKNGNVVLLEGNEVANSGYHVDHFCDRALWTFVSAPVEQIKLTAELKKEDLQGFPVKDHLNPIIETATEKKPKFKPIERPHYTIKEFRAREAEKAGNFALAKQMTVEAHARMALDLEIDAEEAAIHAGHLLSKASFDSFGKTEQLAWNMKCLKLLKHYKNQLGEQFYW